MGLGMVSRRRPEACHVLRGPANAGLSDFHPVGVGRQGATTCNVASRARRDERPDAPRRSQIIIAVSWLKLSASPAIRPYRVVAGRARPPGAP